jgi:arsenite-transporting ATPase
MYIISIKKRIEFVVRTGSAICFRLIHNREISRLQSDIPESVKNLLPMLRNADETEVLIITLAETTPAYEAMRLESDLKRAGINSKWWIINASLYATETTNKTLQAKASNEIEWINKVDKYSNGNFAVIEWTADKIKGEKLLDLIE